MATPLMLGNNAPQTFFDKSLKGSPFPLSQLSGFFQKPIQNLYGCLHVRNHIILYSIDVNVNFLRIFGNGKDSKPGDEERQIMSKLRIWLKLTFLLAVPFLIMVVLAAGIKEFYPVRNPCI